MENSDDQPVLIAALYLFFDFNDFEDWLPRVQQVCDDNDLRGIMLLAHEGINGTVGGPEAGIHRLLDFFRADPRMAKLEAKFSRAPKTPFRREQVRVRLKKEIVTMGVPDIDPLAEVGEYVSPDKWNDLINDPEVVLVDTRNDYETLIGKFKGAIEPNTEDFRHFPEWVDEHLDPVKQPKVAMYCTGGIRCEKATALMKRKGFKEVYHLHGGILKYLEETSPEQSQWEGECFVFDHRVSVDHALQPGHYALRWECGHPRPVDSEEESCPICRRRADAHDNADETL
ncbi:MAG: rhodanese-related sulfurtransferase [Puniceicoccales bacterium]